MRSLVILAVVFVSVGCFAAESKKGGSTTAAERPSNEVYIPKDLEECFRELDKRVRPEDVTKIRKGEIQAIDMHFGLGMGLRNSWGLWRGSRLAKYFNEMGIFHPDDMSAIILQSYVRYLRKQPLRVEEQVAEYKEYWDKAKKAAEEAKKTKG